MRRKLVALDLDGTLLQPDGTLAGSTRDAVRAILDAGHAVCIATGRNRGESEPVVDALAHHGPHVYVGGAMTVDTARNETISATTMRPPVAAGVCSTLHGRGLNPLVLQTGGCGFARFVRGPTELPPQVRDWHERTGAEVVVTEDLPGFDHAATVRVSTLGKPADVDAAWGDLDARFGDRIFAYKVTLAHYGVELLEVFDPQSTKWNGVKTVAGVYGIDPADTIAVGDDNNDLPMLRHAGRGVAMGNAKPAARQAAGEVIGRNDEDGLAMFLRTLIA